MYSCTAACDPGGMFGAAGHMKMGAMDEFGAGSGNSCDMLGEDAAAKVAGSLGTDTSVHVGARRILEEEQCGGHQTLPSARQP